MTIEEELLALIKEGYSIIPSGGGAAGKAPLLKTWKPFQLRLPSKETAHKWMKLNPPMWGMCTGRVSGTVTVDIDDIDAMSVMEEAGLKPHVRTPRGGAHYYFQHPGHPVTTKAKILPGIDIRGDGGFCNIIGRNPKTGGEYNIEILPTRDKLYLWSSMPQRVLEAIEVGSDATMEQTAAKQGELICDGQRNCALTSLAGAMRSKGMTEPEILAALLIANHDRCQPPLTEGEVKRIARSICQYKPSENERFTDTGNAELLAKLYGEQLRYNHRQKKWLVWSDNHWAPDRDGKVSRLVIDAARIRLAMAGNLEDSQSKETMIKWALGSESNLRIGACLSISKTIVPFADIGEGWDTDRMLMGCENGVIDLRTGRLRDGYPEDRITMTTGLKFDPNAKCPRWLQFIKEIFPDPELADWVWRVLGYSITGNTAEHIVLIGFGPGANGKTRFLNAIRAALGDYAQNTPFSTFALPKTTSTNDLASLENARFVTSSETTEGTRLNEERIKAISGEDPVKARYLYKEFVSFEPHLKLWLFVNHKPEVMDDSFGIWRRMRLIPFTVRFSGQNADKRLGETLRAEAPGILAWLVKGCLGWQKRGLTPLPKCVEAATQQYQRENDVLTQFIEDWCTVAPERQTKAGNLYTQFRLWAEGQGMKKDALTSSMFGRRMTERFSKVKRADGWYYQGIGIEIPDDDPKTPESP